MAALYHLASGVKYLATAKRQHASDLLTARQLAWPDAVRLPPGLEVTWIGTAGVRMAYQGVTLWIDPYVTRLSFRSLALRRVVPANESEVARVIDSADAVLVGHTHFDHAMDVPAIVRRFGCPAYGSSSLAHLMALYELPSIEVAPHRDYEVGPFRFHFVPSQHSKLQLGLGIPYSGELTCEHVDELIPQAYCCGQVWGIHVEVAGVRFYHQGSADLIEDEIRDHGVDYFLCGISGRRFTPRYIERVVARLKPGAVIPTHYDDFFRPLDEGRFSFNVNLTGFADEVRAASRDLPLYVLPAGVTVGT